MRITIRTELEVRIQVFFSVGSAFLIRGRLRALHTPELYDKVQNWQIKLN